MQRKQRTLITRPVSPMLLAIHGVTLFFICNFALKCGFRDEKQRCLPQYSEET